MLKKLHQGNQCLSLMATIIPTLPLRTYIRNGQVSIYNNRWILNSLDIWKVKDSYLFTMSGCLMFLVFLSVCLFIISSLKRKFRRRPKLNNVGLHCQWRKRNRKSIHCQENQSKNKLYKWKTGGKNRTWLTEIPSESLSQKCNCCTK